MAMRKRVTQGGGQSNSSSTLPPVTVGEGAVGIDPDDVKRDLEKYDEDMGDSKGPKLTLMEEVLLLGLKDREVRTVIRVCSVWLCHSQCQ